MQTPKLTSSCSKTGFQNIGGVCDLSLLCPSTPPLYFYYSPLISLLVQEKTEVPNVLYVSPPPSLCNTIQFLGFGPVKYIEGIFITALHIAFFPF